MKMLISVFLISQFFLSLFRQWLPPDKIERLGVDENFDQSKMATSGHSKRSVKEAYCRAKQYQERVSMQPIIQKSNSDNITDV